MAGTQQQLQSVALAGTGTTVRVDDCVVVGPQGTRTGQAEVARVAGITREGEGGPAQLSVVWFYRPEHVLGGRQSFHGARELIETSEASSVPLSAVTARCRVHGLAQWQTLHKPAAGDWFARFAYKVAAQEFVPQEVPVLCRCEAPYNPDKQMLQCRQCLEWFHPECLQVKAPPQGAAASAWQCPDCSPPVPGAASTDPAAAAAMVAPQAAAEQPAAAGAGLWLPSSAAPPVIAPAAAPVPATAISPAAAVQLAAAAAAAASTPASVSGLQGFGAFHAPEATPPAADLLLAPLAPADGEFLLQHLFSSGDGTM